MHPQPHYSPSKHLPSSSLLSLALLWDFLSPTHHHDDEQHHPLFFPTASRVQPSTYDPAGDFAGGVAAAMMLFHTRGNGSAMEEARTMALGGLSLDLTMAFCSSEQEALPIRRCPVQLDLLPLCPLSQHSAAQSASAEPLSSLTQTSRFPLLAASCRSSKGADQDGVSVAQMHSCSASAPPRGIDMNQMPSSDDDDADVSSPNSILSPFHATATAALRPTNQIHHLKRERQSFTEFDQELDRGGEATSRGSDDDEEEEGEEDEGRISRKKLRLSKQQAALLEESFKEHSTLNPKQKTALAKKLNLRPRQVEVWFQNRRARSKLKQTETDCELLKHCCESLTEENRRLHKELQELRAMKLSRHCIVAPDLFMPLPAATLTICPSCTSRGSQIKHISSPQLTTLRI